MADLEPELRDVGTRLAVPEPPDLRAAVRARVDRPATGSAIRWRRWVVAVVAALVAGGLVASPQARAALADMLRFAGVEVEWGSDDPTGPPNAPLPGQQPTTLAAARAQVDFPVAVPAALGTPDQVFVADQGRVVSLRYGSGSDQIRLDVFEGRLDPVFIKTIREAVTYVRIAGVEAMWLTEPHVVRYVDRDGEVRDASARLSASTLIWERGKVSYRLEGELTRERATAIAASVR